MGDFTTLHNVLLPDGLQSIDTRGVTLSDLHDLAETALANDSNQLELVNRQRLTLYMMDVNYESIEIQQ